MRMEPITNEFGDEFAKMVLEVLKEARMNQYVLEECAEQNTRFTLQEQIVAMEVHTAVVQWSAVLSRRMGLNGLNKDVERKSSRICRENRQDADKTGC